jgi:hypothetical protein
MSKIEVGAFCDAIEIDGATGIRLEETRQEASNGYRRSILITTDLGDFRLTVRAKSEAALGIKVPAKITL